MPGCSLHSLPFFYFVRWYAYHACLRHPLAFYASLHVCLHVHAWILLASVSSMLHHNEDMDTRSKPTFVPRGHHLLFAFCLFVFLLSCLFVYLMAHHVSCHMLCYACYVYHAFLLYASFTCSLYLFPSIACLLVSCSCLYMYTHGARTHGAKARSPRHKQKGRGYKLVDISQAAMFSRLRGLASPIWLCTLLNPLPSSLISLLDCLY